jgi:stress-induced morphogen
VHFSLKRQIGSHGRARRPAEGSPFQLSHHRPDPAGGGPRDRHRPDEATVISAAFKGKSRVQQHQLVYDALKGEMSGALHALALQTGVPE